MKSKISIILFSLVLLLSCTVSKNAPIFKDYGEVNKDSCVLYIVRGTNIYGSAVPWSLFIKKYNINSGKFEDEYQMYGIYQNTYTPLVLKSNALYSITFGSNILLFSGIPNSQSIYKLAGLKGQIEAIKRNSIGCIGTETGFPFKKEQIKEWAKAITQTESFTNISIKKSLLDAEFEILVPQRSSALYSELQTLRISGKRSAYINATYNKNY
jgi:hypothetical protein